MKQLKENSRRGFFKTCGLATMPLLLPTMGLGAESLLTTSPQRAKSKPAVNFMFDGLFFSPQDYLQRLNEIDALKPIEQDLYGQGGATAMLESEFAKITGKEKAIYMPTGTMANQLAIKLLSGSNTKIVVPENSHVFRDEADAAQSVHQKRLVPLGLGKPYFDLEDLKTEIQYLNENEVFKSGLGVVVIENPVRRADGKMVPLEVIKEISQYCRQHGYKLHLDGARLHLASAYSAIPISEYAEYFDTVYISLYKCLHAAGGAILCGDAALIDQMAHHIKIHGGTSFQSWNNTSMALYYLNGIDERWGTLIRSANNLIAALNKIKGVTITGLENGTNIYELSLAEEINLKVLADYLHQEWNMRLGKANDKGVVRFVVNESLLSRNLPELVLAWEKGIEKAYGQKM